MATGTLNNGIGNFNITTLNPTITLYTANKYVDSDLVLNLHVNDANLIPANIANGVTILGVTGNHKGAIISETTDAHGGTIETITLENVVRLQDKTVTPTTSQQIITPDTGYTGFEQVTINAAMNPDWRGGGAELVQNYGTTTLALSDTTYSSWTPSTSSSSVKAATSLAAYTADLANYEYIVEQIWTSVPTYGSGTTTTPRFIKLCSSYITNIYRRPNSLSDVSGSIYGTNTSNSITNGLTDYYNSSGTRTFAPTTYSYGIYPSWSSASYTNTSITPKIPAVYARCSTSYFGTAAAAEVTACTIKVSTKIYRMPYGKSLYGGFYRNIVTAYNS